MPKDAPLAVELPASNQDKPAWVKVGVIAAVGFIVGIAWPRVFGVRLGPAAPHESSAAAASGSSHAGRAPEAPPASVVTKTPVVASAASAASASAVAVASATPAGTPPTITMGKGTVLTCKTSEGETKKGKECGPVPGIDQLVSPRVKKIATCSGVEGQSGKLSLVVNADFASGRFWYDVGKSSTVPNVDAVSACLKTSFHGTSTEKTPHEHPRYTVAYTATFAAGEGDKSTHKAKEAPAEEKPAAEEKKPAAPGEEKKESAAPGEATVAWEVALVRDTPKTGEVVSRLPRGTKVKAGAAKDGWIQIKFGDNFGTEGWVYRGAIGR
jgi:hypothetical protein